MSPNGRCSFLLLSLLPLCLLSLAVVLVQAARPYHFVESFADYKKNHIDAEVHYSYRYYLDHPTQSHFSHEERSGSRVTGQYGLLEPGGSVRHVRYEVDGDGGFRASVQTRTAASRTHQLLRLDRKQAPKIPVWHAKPVAYIF